MTRRKIFRYAITGYNALVSLFLLYVIVTSLTFTCEYVFKTVPAGSVWVFSVVGFAFACKTFFCRMADMAHKADRLSLESNKDLISACIILAVGVVILLFLAWAWIKIYPHF